MSHPDQHHQEEEDDEQQIDPNDVVAVYEFDGEDDAPMDDDDDDDEEQGLEAVREGDEGDEMDEDDQEGPVEDNSLGHSLHHGQSSSVFTLSLHPNFPNPPLAISGGEDDLGYIFSPLASSSTSPFEPVKLTGHTDSVIAASFSNDGELAATGGMDGKVRVWRRVKGKNSDASTGGAAADLSGWQNWEFLTSLDTSDEVTWIAWHPKGPVLAAGCNDSTVWMWQLPSGNTMQVFYSHTEPCTAGLFTPSGKLLVTTSADQSLCVWDPRESTPLLKLAPNATAGYGHFSAEGEGGITALAVAPASNLIAIGGANGAIRVINLPNGNVVGQLRGHKQGESVESLQFMDILGLAGPGGEGSGTKGLVLVSCGTDNRAIVWDVTTGNARAEVSHEDVITSIAPHPAPHRHLFTSGSADRVLRTWDARTGALIAEHKGHAGVINDVKVGRAPAGWGLEEGAEDKGAEVVVSAGDDGAVLVWRV